MPQISGISTQTLNISNLLKDISVSVSKLTGGEGASSTQQSSFDSQAVANSQTPLNFSYNIAQISGNSLYSVQQYASSHPQKDRQAAYGEYYKQSQNTDLPASQTEEPLSSYTFKDFVTSQNKSIFYQQATSIYKGGTLGLETFSNMTGNKGLNRNYAVNAYNYVYNINKQPSVLIDFMHEYNQNFNVEI